VPPRESGGGAGVVPASVVAVSRSRIAWLLIAPSAVLIAVGACTGKSAPAVSGDVDTASIVLAVPHEPVSLNPLAGYAEAGAAKIFDGLVEHRPDHGVDPALAEELPQPSPDGRSWTVRLRPGVRFSDGTEFDARDVTATYAALRDPAFGSPLRARYDVLTGVTEVDPRTVRFDLAHAYAPFPNLLVLGILPSEALTVPAPVTLPDPVPAGTGPYTVADWHRGERMVLRANKSYFDGPPSVETVTVRFVPDDERRAALVREGTVDGAALPARMARDFDGADAFAVITQSSADVRAVRMPAGNQVAADAAIRTALNHAVNRAALVDGALAGRGSQVSVPLPPTLAEFVEPTARFTYDMARARQLLDAAGWTAGEDGTRARAGVPARFTLLYPTDDAVALGLAEAFAADARAVGVDVLPQPADAATIEQRARTEPSVIATGDPFDPDLSLFPLLHSLSGTAAAGVPRLDQALAAGRTVLDPAQRAAEYRKLQRIYVAEPTMVALAAVDHTYVMRDSWLGYEPVVDRQAQDATWGPWWNVERWQRR